MRNAIRISFIFLCSGFIWITVSDKLVFDEIQGDELHLINSLKGYFFIAGLSLVLYVLIYKNDKKLLNEQLRLKDIQELSDVGDWEYYIDKKHFRISDEVLRILKIHRTDEFISMEALMAYIHPADRNKLKYALHEILLTGKEVTLHHRVISKNGRVRFVRQAAKPLHSAKMVRGTCQDITETIELRDSLKETHEENKRMGEIISKVKNFVLIMDASNKITWTNKAFEERTGFSLSEIHHFDAATFGLTGSGNDLNGHLHAAGSNRVYSIDIKTRSKSGEEFWTEVTMTPIMDEYGISVGTIAIGTEITDRKEAQELLRRQYIILKDIAWKTSHEIRRPAASILALNNLIRNSQTMEEKEEIFEMLNTCTIELDAILRQINQKINEEVDGSVV